MPTPPQIHAEHEQARIGNFPNERRKPPEWLLDKIAQEKLMGGYRRKRNKLCPNCNVLMSNVGSCTCSGG